MGSKAPQPCPILPDGPRTSAPAPPPANAGFAPKKFTITVVYEGERNRFEYSEEAYSGMRAREYARDLASGRIVLERKDPIDGRRYFVPTHRLISVYVEEAEHEAEHE